MMNYITFNGVSSADFGIYVGGQASFSAPKKTVTKVSIPGRNGDFVIDNGVFNNIDVSYTILGIGNFKEKINQIKEWLLSPLSYARLEDTYNPDYYRLGMLSSGIDFTMYCLNRTGKAVITFDCKPQRWLTIGDTPYELESSGVLTNPTAFYAKPLIHAVGNGHITISGTRITIADTFPEVYIDCETMDCYSGSENANAAVSFSTNDFPTLKPGRSAYAVGANFTSVDVTPRWWSV